MCGRFTSSYPRKITKSMRVTRTAFADSHAGHRGPTKPSMSSLLEPLKSFTQSALQMIPPQTFLGSISGTRIAGSEVDVDIVGGGFRVVVVELAGEEHAKLNPAGECMHRLRGGEDFF